MSDCVADGMCRRIRDRLGVGTLGIATVQVCGKDDYGRYYFKLKRCRSTPNPEEWDPEQAILVVKVKQDASA